MWTRLIDTIVGAFKRSWREQTCSRGHRSSIGILYLWFISLDYIYRNHRLKGVAVVEPSIDNTEQGLAAKVVDNMSDVSMSVAMK